MKYIVNLDRNQVVLIIIFIIYPLFALPFIIEKIYYRRNYALTLLAVFMGLCAILIAPTGDLYRHTENYFSYREMSHADFIDSRLLQVDIVLYHLSYWFAQWHINFEILRFLFVFISYECVFWLLKDITKQNPLLQNSRKYYFIGFLLLFLSVPFFNITLGLRYGLGMNIMIVGLYKIFYKKQCSGWFWGITACLIHFSFIGIIVAAFISRSGLFRLKKWWVIIVSLLLILFSDKILESLISFLPLEDLVKAHLLNYVSGYWANEFFDDFSLLFRISRILSYWVIYPLLFFFLLYYKNENKLYDTFLLLMILVLGLSYPFGDVFPRMSILLIPLYLAFLLIHFIPVKAKIIALQLISLFIVISFLANIYSNKRQLSISCEQKLLYSSLPAILFHTYSPEWIYGHVSEDGDIK